MPESICVDNISVRQFPTPQFLLWKAKKLTNQYMYIFLYIHIYESEFLQKGQE